MLTKLRHWLKGSDEPVDSAPRVSEGNGNAVFLSDMTEADYEDYLKEQSGWKGWLKKYGIE